MDDHVVPIYKNPHPLSIAFTVSKYASETLEQFTKKLRLGKGLEQWELAKRLQLHRNRIYEWENDRHRPSGRSIGKSTEFFKTSAKTLEDFKTERNISEVFTTEYCVC